MDPTLLLTLPNALTWLAGGGAAVLVLWLLDRDSPWVNVLDPEVKRYAAYVLTGGLAVLFWYVKAALYAEPLPQNVTEWADIAYKIAAGAVAGNQLLHARFSMGKH